MSRIFDALRRVEQMKSGVGVETPSEAAVPTIEEVLKPLSPEMDQLESVETVTCRPQPETHLLGPGERDRAALERFKLLRYRLYQLRQQRTVKSLVVSSAIPKEGKSMVSANLAVTLAQSSDRVLLVDADLRKPSLHSMFGMSLSEGLAGYLQGRVELMKSIRRLDPLRLFFLPAGRSPSNPVELLQGELMRSAMTTATAIFDWVVIDSPPVLPIADGRFLASMCDAAVVVTREGHSRQEELRECLSALKGTFTAGIVLNGSTAAVRTAYSYYFSNASAGEVKKRSHYFATAAARGQA